MTDFYFPAGTWCDVFNKTQGKGGCQTFSHGQNITLETKAWNFYVHLREGYIVPLQDTAGLKIKTLGELQRHPVDFHVHPGCSASVCQATGEYLNNDGLVLDLTGNQNTYQLSYRQRVGENGFTLYVQQLS